jgi:hypothetical protein
MRPSFTVRLQSTENAISRRSCATVDWSCSAGNQGERRVETTGSLAVHQSLDDALWQVMLGVPGIMWQMVRATWQFWVLAAVVIVLRVLLERAARRSRRAYSPPAYVTERVVIHEPRRDHDPTAALQSLASLHATGALTSDEWTRAKEIALAPEGAHGDRVAGQIRSLHQLHKEGALSESEYNSKKWDLLASRR